MQNLYDRDHQSLGVGKFLWEHKRKISIVWATGFVLTLAYLSTASREYESEAKLLIRPGRESVALDPTAKTGQLISSAETRESPVYEVEELLTSRALGEKVIDRLGPDVILERDPNKKGLSQRLSWLNSLNLNPLRVYSIRDVALKAFDKNLNVSAPNKTNIVTLSYSAKDPEVAQKVLETLIDVAQGEYLRIHRVKGSQEFFVEQSDLLKEKLARLERQLRDLKSQSGVSSPVTQRDLLLKLADSLEADLVRARAEQSAAQAEVEQRRQELGNTPALVVTSRATGLPQTTGQTLREKLYDLEVREREAAARMTPAHPMMVALRNQLDESRQIAQREEVSEQVTQGVNSTHQAAELAVQERQAGFAAQVARTQSLETAVAGVRDKLKRLNDSELDVLDLEREIELAQNNYQKYSENLEEARINQALEEAKISSLNVMQAPSFSETPVKPSPIVVLFTGFVLSGIAGVAVALLGHFHILSRIMPTALRSGSNTSAIPHLGSPLARRGDMVFSEANRPKPAPGNGHYE